MIGEVTRAIRAMQESVDPIRGNIEALLQAPVERHPDQDLLDLGAAFDKAVSDWLVAAIEHDEADERADALRPKQPEVLIITSFDVTDGFPINGSRKHDVRGRTWTPDQIEEIRAAPPRQGYYLGGGKPAGLRINEKAEQRKAEILAAYDDHAARTKAVEDECGFTAAESEHDRLGFLTDDLTQRIIKTPATTTAGLAVKLRVYVDLWGPPKVSDHSDVDDRIVQSVFVDIARIGGAA